MKKHKFYFVYHEGFPYGILYCHEDRHNNDAVVSVVNLWDNSGHYALRLNKIRKYTLWYIKTSGWEQEEISYAAARMFLMLHNLSVDTLMREGG